MNKIMYKIRLDGNVPGLSEHMLSLTHFGDFLIALNKGLRHTASKMLSDAISPEQSKAGALKKEARRLDLMMSRIERGCAQPVFEVFYDLPHIQTPVLGEEFIGDFDLRAARALFDGLKKEANGERVNWVARQILGLIPHQVDVREFELYEDGALIDRFNAPVPQKEEEIALELPTLRMIYADIVTFGVEHQNHFVGLTSEEFESKAILPCSACPSLVDRAWGMKGQLVLAQVLFTPKEKRKAKLLNVFDASRDLEKFAPDEVEREIQRSWAGTFRFLEEAGD